MFRTLEITGDPVPVLLDLHILNLRLAVPDVGRVNRPVALHVVGWLLGPSDLQKNSASENKSSKPQRRVHGRDHFLHDILL